MPSTEKLVQSSYTVVKLLDGQATEMVTYMDFCVVSAIGRNAIQKHW